MNDIAVAAKDPRLVVRERLEARRTEIKNALPSDITADAFIRAYTTAIQLNPDLLVCTWQSQWDALMKACRAGLLPDGVESAVVPYKSRATFIPMVTGVLRSARRSGQIKWIRADVVRQGETFQYEITHEGPIFRHVPGDDSSAPVVKGYAVAGTKDGGFYSAVLTKAEIDKRRSYSRAQRDDSPWNSWYDAMAIKTCIHALGKFLPSVRDAMQEDDSMPGITLPPTAAPREVETLIDVSPSAGTPHSAEGGEQEESNIESPAAASSSPEAVAYQAGVAAKEKGATKKAMPGEYRGAERVREQIAWIAGLEGKPMPTFEYETDNRGGQDASHD